MRHPSVTSLLMPRSIAVVGASRDRLKWGNQLVRHTREAGFAGALYGVNPTRGAPIPGATMVTDIRECEEPPDFAILAVPKKATVTALAECLEFGIRTVIVPGSGFGERSIDGERLQNELLELVHRHAARVLGPNCFGIYSSVGAVNVTPFRQVPHGRVALLSQSGNLAEQAFMGARHRGFGFSHAVGLGNQLDLTFADFLDWLERDPHTTAIGMYVEGLPPAGGTAFTEALDRCVRAGKTVVALKGGVSATGAVATASHTGSLSADSRVWETALRSAGAVVVTSMDEMLDVLLFAQRPVPPSGRRVGLITDGGGDSILALDAISAQGLSVRPFSQAFQEELEILLPPDAPRGVGGNPITLDTAGGVADDPAILARCAAAVSGSGEVDIVVLGGLFGTYEIHRTAEIETARALIAIARDSPALMAVHAPAGVERSEPIRILREGGLPVFEGMTELARGLRAYQHLHAAEMDDASPAGARAGRLHDPATTWDLLHAAGVPLPPQAVVTSPGELSPAADRIGYPVCLKIASAGVVHKSDVGGVVVGIASYDHLTAAAQRIWRHFPGANLLLMPSFEPGFEVVVGARHDAQFGPVAVVGRGGIWAEVEQDTALIVGAYDDARVNTALRSLRCWPILRGDRGRPSLAFDELRPVVRAVMELVRSRPDLELDLNPIILYPDGLAVADSRILGR